MTKLDKRIDGSVTHSSQVFRGWSVHYFCISPFDSTKNLPPFQGGRFLIPHWSYNRLLQPQRSGSQWSRPHRVQFWTSFDKVDSAKVLLPSTLVDAELVLELNLKPGESTYTRIKPELNHSWLCKNCLVQLHCGNEWLETPMWGTGVCVLILASFVVFGLIVLWVHNAQQMERIKKPKGERQDYKCNAYIKALEFQLTVWFCLSSVSRHLWKSTETDRIHYTNW